MDARLPYSFARQHGILLDWQQGTLTCGLREGITVSAMAETARICPSPPQFIALSPEAFEARLAATYRDDAVAASDAAGADGDLASLADSTAIVDDLLDQSDDAPVVRLINALLSEAIKEGASDIHIETQERRLVVRLRVDGILRSVVEPKRALAPLLVSRIKVMARLDIAEKRLPQDGRVSLRVGGHEVDVRVSTIPSQYGERVVMRLLDRDATRLGLDKLGMSPRDAATFARMLSRPDGMLLVTGPTGSGKTTTLYAGLDHLNDSRRNIMTIEDPIEYSVDGVGQMQVNARTELTFARGLRAILRQDPDVIMVGEIRDRETAQVAVESAMTGHFVLSTLHTNTAIGAIARLIDMGVERFLLAPMLVGVVAQRLVRHLCPTCKTTGPATSAEAALVPGLVAGETVARANGCAACHGQGYRGRSGIYDVIAIDQQLAAMITAGASEAAMTEVAHAGDFGLVRDGLRLIRAGLTSVREVARVVQEG
ncbi:MAG: Flp pilus assembly complex ATPase component TadA [Rhodobacteraceae bacterium]|jgi:general secretion pathway protein E|nr:Flp pilus assembly complex ATPase component TadA [Paracoccaceae bacterium]